MEWDFQKIIKVEPRPDYKLYVEFEDGRKGIKDMSALVNKGVFKDLKDPNIFKQVNISKLGAPTWPNGIDLAPDSLYETLQ